MNLEIGQIWKKGEYYIPIIVTKVDNGMVYYNYINNEYANKNLLTKRVINEFINCFTYCKKRNSKLYKVLNN